MRMEKPPAIPKVQKSQNRLPAWCWLLVSFLVGGSCVSLAAFVLVVDDKLGGQNEGSLVFGAVLGV
jgi:hypothetical protein